MPERRVADLGAYALGADTVTGTFAVLSATDFSDAFERLVGRIQVGAVQAQSAVTQDRT